MKIITFILCALLEGCVLSNGCNIKPDQSQQFVEPGWIQNNLKKNGFSFDCEADVYSTSNGRTNGLKVAVDLSVEETYLSLGVPMLSSSVSQIRSSALSKAQIAAIKKIMNKFSDIIGIDNVH